MVELINMEHLQGAIDDLKAAGEDQLAHDLEYVGKALEKGFNEDVWHNNALVMMTESLADSFVKGTSHAILAHGPAALPVLVQALIEGAFISGYIAGEGPDHIDQCRCH